MEKVVLAYSGGLDTSIIIPWLKENYGYEVIAFCADLGQGEELAPVHDKAMKSGASKVYIEDLTEEFITDYIYPVLKAGAKYEKNTCWELHLPGRLLPRRWLKSQKRRRCLSYMPWCYRERK
jgi:argininosuccinate synthase